MASPIANELFVESARKELRSTSDLRAVVSKLTEFRPASMNHHIGNKARKNVFAMICFTKASFCIRETTDGSLVIACEAIVFSR